MLAVDLFCGLGGWTDGLLAEGWDVIGFDIERHAYGDHRYPAQLVLQDVRTLHGSQFRDVDLIVASPPCQEYSYMAMPWTRAKKLAEEYRSGVRDVAKLTELFDACFRIQREACAAAGRHIPLIVENVRGAIPWVGRSRWNYGSFHLWGDVPALMPMTMKRGQKVPGFRFDGNGGSFQSASVEGVKVAGLDWNKRIPGQAFNTTAESRVRDEIKNASGGSWFGIGSPGQKELNRNARDQLATGIKQGGDWFNAEQPSISRLSGSKSTARKAASAMIAKIPLPLARHIGRVYASVSPP